MNKKVRTNRSYKVESQYNIVKGRKPRRAYTRPLSSYLKTADELCGRRKRLQTANPEFLFILRDQSFVREKS